MSLSQKHSGLILVPWFNSAEWHYVYRLVYSNDKEKQEEALNLLKTWKIRTPILSTGVEGTLVLLEVLILDMDCLSDEQLSNLYAVALMRFLNLSAANSEKQGSFKKTSAENDLPQWLINLRHDIAHGHQIPSKSNLKMGLIYGLTWLKEKYWEPQSEVIKDYYVSDETKLDDTLIGSLEVYVEINMNLFEDIELDSEFFKKISNIVYKKSKKQIVHPYLMLDIFLEMITKSFEKDCSISNIKSCLDILISTKAMLKPNFNVTSGNEGTVKLHQNFVRIWWQLLNLFHHYGMLFHLVYRLFDVIRNIAYTDQAKKMASLWINELILALHSTLQHLKEPNEISKQSILCLEKNIYTYFDESLKFQNQVLYSSAKDSSATFVEYFMDNLLKYNHKNNNENFGSDALNLLKVDTLASENLCKVDNKIYTLEDLKFVDLKIEELQYSEPAESEKRNDLNEKSVQIIGGNKWKKIEDTSIFRNCPLGVLPHQIHLKHPFLVVD